MFGDEAARLAGLIALVWGWAPDRFWAATPAEVAAVVAAMTPIEAPPVTRALLAEMEKTHG